jgi:hypothetical protein
MLWFTQLEIAVSETIAISRDAIAFFLKTECDRLHCNQLEYEHYDAI